jgi:mannose-6-phosphate isomerase
MSDCPIVFEPIAMERVWGGRRFETLRGKSLPHGTPVGELWEIVDREDAQSVVHSGSLAGRKLHDLWSSSLRTQIFGEPYRDHPSARFPILVKLLDARERLSVQVHPPAGLAAVSGGEPKTEVWFFLDALPGARIYAGLRKGVTRSEFEALLHGGNVERALHEISVSSGESIFIPSGRLHAIGEGNLIVEVQQNSDTTYRVFDWNRTGLDGKPRTLHIEASMASIDFEDFEPSAADRGNPLVADCEFFRVEKCDFTGPIEIRPRGRFALATVVGGTVTCGNGQFEKGQMFLVPANAPAGEVKAFSGPAEILVTTLPV